MPNGNDPPAMSPNSLGVSMARTITRDEIRLRGRVADTEAMERNAIVSQQTAAWEEQRRAHRNKLSEDADRQSELARNRRKRAAQFAALMQEEHENRLAIEKVFHESIKMAVIELRHEFQSRAVPRLSQLPRVVACGSPTALVHKQLRAENKEHRLLLSSGNSLVAKGECSALIRHHSASGIDTEGGSPSRNATEVSRLSELRRTLHQTILQASTSASRVRDEEGTSWVSVDGAVYDNRYRIRHDVDMTTAPKMTVAERQMNVSTSKKRKQKPRRSPALEDKPARTKRHPELEALYCCSAPRTAIIRVFHHSSSEFSDPGPTAGRNSTNPGTLVTTAAVQGHSDCDDSCVVERQVSTPPPHVTSKGSIQRRLREVELDMKRRVEQLDQKTKRSQQLQDVKMRALAAEEEKSRLRYIQMMRGLREESRVNRLHDREGDLQRAESLSLNLQNVRREFDIKRVEAHVELRQKYMLEDRVSALRKTLSELANVSHFAATVPSLNLTKALKDAHFAAEGLTSHPDADDP